MLFYESTNKAVVASLWRWLGATSLLRPGRTLELDSPCSINLAEIGTTERPLAFDNIFHLSNCVPLSSLQRIDVVVNDLITTHPSRHSTQEIFRRHLMAKRQNILISLTAKYAEKIFAGEKQVELRRRASGFRRARRYDHVKLPLILVDGKVEAVHVSSPHRCGDGLAQSPDYRKRNSSNTSKESVGGSLLY
jgi:hypothetical protein